MKKFERVILLALFITNVGYSNGQEQVEDINNLVHPTWYVPSTVGKIGDVLKLGHGAKNLVLLTGLGFDHSVFTDFMMQHKDTYTMFAFTEAGIGNTIAPQIPQNQNYGSRTWSKAFENAVIKYLNDHDINSYSLLGFFSGGVQHAIHIADLDKEKVEKMVLVSGELYRIGGPKVEPALRAKQAKGMAESWFKTVSRETWYNGMFPSEIYAKDSILAQRLWEIPNQPKISTQIQYITEFIAEDSSKKLAALTIPTLVIIPSFNEGFLSQPGNDFIENTFINEWKKFASKNKRNNFYLEQIPNSNIFVFYDNPMVFNNHLSNFLEK